LGSQPQPKTAIAIRPISGTVKATDFKFGRYIHVVHPNKSPFKFWRKGAWAYPKTAQIFGVLLIISRMGKATNFKCCAHIHSIRRKKSRFKILTKVAVGIVRDSHKFSGYSYIGCITRSSKLCDSSAFLFVVLVERGMRKMVTRCFVQSAVYYSYNRFRLTVRLSVCHRLVLCQNDSSYDHADIRRATQRAGRQTTVGLTATIFSVFSGYFFFKNFRNKASLARIIIWR